MVLHDDLSCKDQTSLYFALNRSDTWLPSNETAVNIDRFMHCTVYDLVELVYNIMAHAQETIFMYGRNGRVHVLLQQIWGVAAGSWILRWRALQWAYSAALFPLNFPSFAQVCGIT
jgi:hypothetical protein